MADNLAALVRQAIDELGLSDQVREAVPRADGSGLVLHLVNGDEAAWSLPSQTRMVKPQVVTITITDVAGIGPSTAERLAGVGVVGVAALLSADPDALAAQLSGITAVKVRGWQVSARALMQGGDNA